ncbi:SDR family oxidoreductase [uncultured Sphingomonas sp.]|uniref:SDR family oxidoreductase n=1 Tax=uncultured Sphingomonas sp. TaxID=158754 RepID=UPI0035CB7E1A
MPTALVIGASRGLGRALAQELHGRGWQVIATVRDPAALSPEPGLDVVTLDVTDWAGVDALPAKLGQARIDLLFVNAGIAPDPAAPIGTVDPAIFAQAMLTNAYAPLRLIERLEPLTRADATVAVMSSGLGSIANNTTGSWEAYRMTKAALNTGLKSLEARDTGSRTWLAVAPGWVRTDMGGAGAPLSIEQSIPALVDMLEARRETGGATFVDYRNSVVAW